MPFTATNAVARLFNRFGDGPSANAAPPPPPVSSAPPFEAEPDDAPGPTAAEPQGREIDQLRAEIEALKAAILERR